MEHSSIEPADKVQICCVATLSSKRACELGIMRDQKRTLDYERSIALMPSPCDVSSSMKRLIYIMGRKSVTTSSTSNRGAAMNPGSPEPCEGESTRKSHGEPHVIARIWLLMAWHGDRSPHVTLNVGRTVGCNAARLPNLLLPPTRVRRVATKKSKTVF
jgi:hypothetical protein